MAAIPKTIKQEHQELCEKITACDVAYYQNSNPIMPDADYDIIRRRLDEIEEEYHLLKEGSPSQKVGSAPSSTFDNVPHAIQMKSLSNAMDSTELGAWFKRISKDLNKSEKSQVSYRCELKFDGVAVSVRYEKGELVQGLTRGDGRVGEDVTANIKSIEGLPHMLGEGAPEILEVRGEVYMTKKELDRLNVQVKQENKVKEEKYERKIKKWKAEKKRKGDKLKTKEPRKPKLNTPYVNTRNTASGSLRHKHPEVTKERGLKIWIHGTGEIVGNKEWNTLEEQMRYLKGFGLPVNKESKLYQKEESVHKFCKDWSISNKRHSLDYEIDGAVVKINSNPIKEKIDATASDRFPKSAIAFKFPAEEKVTKLKDIKITIGRTGRATPNGVLEPVFVGGSTIELSTLHNEDQVAEKDVRPGDIVVVRKAGDVIPEIVKCVERKKGTEKWVFPSECPSCSSPLVREKGESNHYCHNNDCHDRIVGKIKHFVSRDSLDIAGLGDSTIESLVELGLVKDMSDLFALTEDDLMNLPRMGEKKAANLMAEIEKSKNPLLNKLWVGFGIHLAGRTISRILAQHFNSLDEIMSTNVRNLSKIKGVGVKAAENIVEFWQDKKNMDLVDKLKEKGITMDNIEEQANDKSPQNLEGKTIVVSGTFKEWELDRDGIKTEIKARGGKTPSSMSGKVYALISGAGSGPKKIDYANENDIPIITEEEDAMRLLKSGVI